MAVTTSTNMVSHTAAGTLNEQFTVSFPFFDGGDLIVIVDDGTTQTTATLNTDYSVSGGDGGLGTVTWLGTPDAGDTISIFRYVPLTQLIELPESGRFRQASVEEALDRAIMAIQQLDQRTGGPGFIADSIDGLDELPTPDASDIGKALLCVGAGLVDWQSVDPFIAQNVIINGAMTVAQRGTSFTSATTPANDDDTYLLDRWLLLSDGNDVADVSQDTSVIPDGAYAAMKLDIETANKKCAVMQIIEARDAARLFGKTCSLSWKMRSNSSAKIENVRAALIKWTGTADSPTSDCISAWGAEGVDPTLAASWAYVGPDPVNHQPGESAYTEHAIEAIDLTSETGNNLAVIFWIDDTDAAVGDLLYITDVQIEPGDTAHEFHYRAFADELRLCERYYCKTFPYATAPAQAAGDSGAVWTLQAGDPNHTFEWAFPTRMRTTPSVTTYNPQSANAKAYHYGVPSDVTATTTGDACDRNVRITTELADESGGRLGIHVAADAEL
jgi:hypothetical protein